MKRILIADSSKASLVMTSEVFKDHYPGIQVLVAKNSAEALHLAKNNNNIDAYILDFDLPDENGAQTALQLKKISSTPILITAFDRDDVNQAIDSLLVKYDDCKSWLKKPVNPEVVIAVAQRYCDGKIRTQKRIPCNLPIIVQIDLSFSNIKEKKIPKNKKEIKVENVSESVKVKGKKIAKKEELQQNCLNFYGVVEDCSLNGVKIKPVKHSSYSLNEWTGLLKKMEDINQDFLISLHLPLSSDIEHGKVQELSKIGKEKIQILNGRIAWINADSGEWNMGIEFSDQSLSKKLFESIVVSQSKHPRGYHTQSSLKTSRHNN